VAETNGTFALRPATRLVGIAALVLVAACGSAPPSQTTRGPVFAEAGRVAPEISRLFAEPPPGGAIPTDLTWSQDGKLLLYRRAVNRRDAVTRELWVHEIANHRERPLVMADDGEVAEFTVAGSEAVVAVVGGDLLHLGLHDGTKKRLTSTAAHESSPRATRDGRTVVFVRDHDLRAIDLTNGIERPLTSGGGELLTHGEVPWVYGEELGVQEGFALSPDGRQLWFLEADLRLVPRRVIDSHEGAPRMQSYPRPGEAIPRIRIGVVPLDGGEIRYLDLASDDSLLPAAVWHPAADRLLVVRLDRLQLRLELLLCDARSGSCPVVRVEQDPRWVEVIAAPRFIDGGRAILWVTEESGFAHLVRLGLDGAVERRLTSGEWDVATVDHVDEQRRQVYFTADAVSPVEDTLLTVPFEGGDAEPVVDLPGCHAGVFAPNGGLVADTHSARDRRPRTELFSIEDGQPIARIDGAELAAGRASEVTTEFFTLATDDGTELEAALTRPATLEPGRRYPLLLQVYGGPGRRLVRNCQGSRWTPWIDLVASRGIYILSVDGRGGTGRGREWARALHLRLVEAPLDDQLQALARFTTRPDVDGTRVAILGWSFGGTLALSALLRAPERFVAGAAVAPVTDWRDYDAIYTERYLDTLSENEAAYRSQSPLFEADQLARPLFLAHGLSDLNVHFRHSARFARALAEAGIDAETHFFPEEGHGVSTPSSRALLFHRLTRFLERHLIPASQRFPN